MKEIILKLRKEGKTYNEIQKIVNLSKGTISYHCNRHGLGGIDLKLKNELILAIKEYTKTHNNKKTAQHFNVSLSTVAKYKDKITPIEISESEKRKKNYERVKTFRQKLKDKSIEYKGGKCVLCGYDKSKWALDFHHQNPNEKDFNLASYKTLKWENIKNELDKCILLCSNCHREEHEKIFLKNLNERLNYYQ